MESPVKERKKSTPPESEAKEFSSEIHKLSQRYLGKQPGSREEKED